MRLEAGFPSQNMKDTDFSLFPKFPRSNQTYGAFQPRTQAHGENDAGNSERAEVLEENVTSIHHLCQEVLFSLLLVCLSVSCQGIYIYIHIYIYCIYIYIQWQSKVVNNFFEDTFCGITF